jgi:uncharacterized protein YegP (UPF0339 family)
MGEKGDMTYYYGKDTKDEWRWQLKADNGRIIAISAVGYRYPGECKQAIELVKGANDAGIQKLSDYAVGLDN